MSCPTCDAVTRVSRRAEAPGLTPMTMIGCTDHWHPLAETEGNSMNLKVFIVTNDEGDVARKIEGTRYRVHQCGALEIFGRDNQPVLVIANDAWSSVEVTAPC